MLNKEELKKIEKGPMILRDNEKSIIQKNNITIDINNIKTGYIYLLQEREFIKTNEKIYKIGRSNQKNFKRFTQYPKGSKILYHQKTFCHKNMEKILVEHFKNKFKQKIEIGNEYFEGNVVDMIREIVKFLLFEDRGKYLVMQSKIELEKYYKKINEKSASDEEVLDGIVKLRKREITIEEFDEIIGKNNRRYKQTYSALQELVLNNIFEDYLTYEDGLKKETNNEEIEYYKLMMNLSNYIITCVKNDPHEGDYYSKENIELIKKCGKKFYKDLMSKFGPKKEFIEEFIASKMRLFLKRAIPKRYHAEISCNWNGIGAWEG